MCEEIKQAIFDGLAEKILSDPDILVSILESLNRDDIVD